MSGRCRACNAQMADEDMCRKFPPDELGVRDYCDLCLSCYDEAIAVLYGNYKEPEMLNDFILRGSHSVSELSEDWS